MKSEQPNRFHEPAASLPTVQSLGSSAGAMAAVGRASEHEYLDDAATAAYLKTSPRKLKDLRLRGGGPRFVRLGQSVRYRRDWCDMWAEQNAVCSTSEETGRRRT